MTKVFSVNFFLSDFVFVFCWRDDLRDIEPITISHLRQSLILLQIRFGSEDTRRM